MRVKVVTLLLAMCFVLSGCDAEYTLYCEDTEVGLALKEAIEAQTHQGVVEDDIYELGNWRYTDLKYLVLCRLCINPVFQGHKFSEILVQHAELGAKKLGAKTIRLDTSSRNIKALNLYMHNGYNAVGLVRYEDYLDEDILLEKYLCRFSDN